jgi:hypothetical protein
VALPYSLDPKAGGTSPDSLQCTVFEGLDPGIAHNGHSRRGLYYVAENTAKINQYAAEDERFRKEGPVS